jgi:hypothetical protein
MKLASNVAIKQSSNQATKQPSKQIHDGDQLLTSAWAFSDSSPDRNRDGADASLERALASALEPINRRRVLLLC